MKLTYYPVTPDRWTDLETLFGSNGACGGCWCMSWRLARKDFETGKGAANKRRLAALVKKDAQPGILAYDGETPVGWLSVAPREEFPALERSRVLSPVDEQPVWSITCLFVKPDYRKNGVSVSLLKAAAKFVATRGGKIVEGYPTEPNTEQPAAFVWTGLAVAFESAGYKEVARRSATRPIMRKTAKK